MQNDQEIDQLMNEALIITDGVQNDTRQMVSHDKFNQHPYDCIGLIKGIKSVNGYMRSVIGTGFLIAQNFVLTNAHNIVAVDFKGIVEEYKKLFFYPAQTGRLEIGYEITAYKCSQKYVSRISDKQKIKQDYAVLKLGNKINRSRYIQLVKNYQNVNSRFSIVGFPGQKIQRRGSEIQAKMYGSQNTNNERLTFTEGVIQHQLSTTEGQSGSAILTLINSTYYAVGIHKCGKKSKTANIGFQITDQIADNIQKWTEQLNGQAVESHRCQDLFRTLMIENEKHLKDLQKLHETSIHDWNNKYEQLKKQFQKYQQFARMNQPPAIKFKFNWLINKQVQNYYIYRYQTFNHPYFNVIQNVVTRNQKQNVQCKQIVSQDNLPTAGIHKIDARVLKNNNGIVIGLKMANKSEDQFDFMQHGNQDVICYHNYSQNPGFIQEAIFKTIPAPNIAEGDILTIEVNMDLMEIKWNVAKKQFTHFTKINNRFYNKPLHFFVAMWSLGTCISIQ